MKAFIHRRYGDPEDVLELREVDVPGIGDDGVLVRVRAAPAGSSSLPELPLNDPRCHSDRM
jgi:hypothetical protein